MSEQSKYAELGVDAGKGKVRELVQALIDNDFPGAWVNIVRSRQLPGFVKMQHADGDGSKIVARILMYLITGNSHWLEGIVDDAFSMNYSDAACAGFVEGEFLTTNTVNVNGFHAPKDKILRAISRRMPELVDLYRRYGFSSRNHVFLLGGETADLTLQVQTGVFDITVSGCMEEENVVRGNVVPGDHIYGFASDGQADWEKEKNSGIMSNGLTLALTYLLDQIYNELYPNLLVHGTKFKGSHKVHSKPALLEDMTVAQALLSPTRQWAILIKILLDMLKADGKFHLLHGISLNSGGGATKVRNLGVGGINYYKRMPTPPAIFQLIQQESKESWARTFEGLNCGVGLDVIGAAGLLPYLKRVEQETHVRLFDTLGVCEAGGNPTSNNVTLETPYGTFTY